MPTHDIQRLQLSPRHLSMLREILAQQASQADAWAYGSRVNGNAHVGSDMDIVLRNPAHPEAKIESFGDIQEAMQASDLPMLVDVHDWACLPAEFRRNIEHDHVVIREGRDSPQSLL